MAKEFVVKLSVDSSGAVDGLDKVTEEIVKTEESTKNLKQQLRALQVEMQGLDPDDAKFQELSRQAAELKDRIDDTSQAIRDNAGNAFEGLSNNAATLGGRLLDLDFAGVGQSARGMANNIKNINVKLLTEEVGGAIKGFASLGKALLMNPIFLVGALIAGIIMNFERLNELMALSYSNETKALEQAKERVALSQQQLDAISEQENILRLQGKTEREILQMKIASTQEVIANTRAQIEQQRMVLAAQLATEQRAKNILKGILSFISAPLQALAIGIDKISEGLVKIGVLDQSFGLSKMLEQGIDSLADMVFSPAEVQQKGEAELAAMEKQLKNLENQRAGHLLAIKNMDKQSSAERAAQVKEQADKELKAKEDALKKEIELERWANDEIARMDAEIEAQKVKDIEAQAARDKAEIDAQRAQDAELQRMLDEMDADQAARAEAKKQRIANDIALTANGLQALADLTEAFAGQSRKSQERAFKVNKALQIAQALIQTYQSATAAYASQVSIPSPDAPVRAAIAAGIAVASGLAQVAKIKATKFDGGTTPPGGTGPGPLASTGAGGVSASPPSFNPLDLRTLQNRPPQAAQTYVLAGQVSNAQDANERIKRLAKLG